ncbi:LacI family DNA-binding transcriptional regulator [Diplocloster hominis]|uniref:LacI family DNA-binding transcriptional regulator n=1 Tax=Diplocloster hominis TaxID=3079010 RepID=UPI0031BB1A6D
MATIKDVARHAGVSNATVSRVIRNENTVTDKTRELVNQAIRELNYQPNALARQLKTQSTGFIIVVVPDIGNTFFHEILFGIEEKAVKSDAHVLIADMHNELDIETYYFNALLQRQVDGVISLSANAARSLMEKAASNYPMVVACQYLENSAVPNVTIDNASASRDIVRHLIGQGRRKIAHLTADPNFVLYRDRLNGYLTALTEAGLPMALELIRYGKSSIQSGYEQTMNLLDSGAQFDAIFAAGDTMAIGAVKALKAAGLQVPKDCAVVGFDDIEMSSVMEPALTTIRQPKYQMGQTAMGILLDLIHGRPVKNPKVIMDYELVVRESCGAKDRTRS